MNGYWLANTECIQGHLDTLVDDADADTNKVYTFAPGENQKPLNKDREYLWFPTIFRQRGRGGAADGPICLYMLPSNMVLEKCEKTWQHNSF